MITNKEDEPSSKDKILETKSCMDNNQSKFQNRFSIPLQINQTNPLKKTRSFKPQQSNKNYLIPYQKHRLKLLFKNSSIPFQPYTP